MRKPAWSTWMSNLWKQHIIKIPRMVHNVDGEKWSVFSITAATGGEKRTSYMKFSQDSQEPQFKAMLWDVFWMKYGVLQYNTDLKRLQKDLTFKNVQLSLSELLGFYQAPTIDESLLCDQLTLEGALHCITFIIQFGFDLFAVPCASMGIIVCRWCY